MLNDKANDAVTDPKMSKHMKYYLFKQIWFFVPSLLYKEYMKDGNSWLHH